MAELLPEGYKTWWGNLNCKNCRSLGVADNLGKWAGVAACCVDTQLKVVDVIERIEDSEYIDALGLRLLAEFVDNIVGVIRVPDGVGTAKQHLGHGVGG